MEGELHTNHQCEPCRQGMASEVTSVSAGTLPQRVCVTADQVPRRRDPSFYLSSLNVSGGLGYPTNLGLNFASKRGAPLWALPILR